jgi:hypothetical protein
LPTPSPSPTYKKKDVLFCVPHRKLRLYAWSQIRMSATSPTTPVCQDCVRMVSVPIVSGQYQNSVK